MAGGDDALADGLGDLLTDQGADQVHDSCHGDGHAQAQGARGYRGGDRVRRVVETVGEVEGEGDDDDRDEQDHQLCLRTMPSTILATCSHSSMADSSVS